MMVARAYALALQTAKRKALPWLRPGWGGAATSAVSARFRVSDAWRAIFILDRSLDGHEAGGSSGSCRCAVRPFRAWWMKGVLNSGWREL